MEEDLDSQGRSNEKIMPNDERLMYDNYLSKVAMRFGDRFKEIEAKFNFEVGVEFEITLCRVFRQVLPQRYGVCRGHVVTQAGDKSNADDIIIYDRDSFPTLRMVEQDGFERRESIPLEAVYAYIEAKHTLHIEGSDGNSIRKAVKQVAEVKTMALSRKDVPWGSEDPYVVNTRQTVIQPKY